MRAWVRRALWLTCAPVMLVAQPVDGVPAPNADVVLLTMGQGDAVWERFGHNALIVPREGDGTPLAYNWGMFDFAQPNFLGRFLTGDTKYWMEPFSVPETLEAYGRGNRAVIAQRLALAPTQRDALARALATNALEANRYYRYDYYRDNCSTRARDAIDALTGGAVRRQLQAMPGTGSYRWHTRRIMQDDLPLYFGAQLVLGVDADAPLTAWDEAFLPTALAASLRRVELPAGDGLPARMLVAREDTLVRAVREAEPTRVPSKLPVAMLVGAGVAGALVLLGRGAKGAAAMVATWALVCALLGTILLLAWFATRHVYMANNPSVALVHTGWLLAIGAAIACWRGRVTHGWRTLMRTLLGIAVVGTAGAALAGHAGSALEMAALFLPGHAAVTWLVDREAARRRAVGGALAR